jgi:hypothetical protein
MPGFFTGELGLTNYRESNGKQFDTRTVFSSLSWGRGGRLSMVDIIAHGAVWEVT